ncbi:ABC transporter ATP-binding protein [Demequina lutea]|uniref:ABC-2 type transport system ATP-binding protein n=1 Tax=Demequina lutea TaxID=431489 RepID=A0A7Y9ZCP9_9MICO|nr:ATP-binding cassette domain-containing protein [Demequina lutea]NYI42696.1 ABC-2 type transport system ATP-binding protein [Demequina lutea]
MTAILKARNLSKTYKIRSRGKDAPKTVEAVKGVDITVNEGEIVGFLGPNGAGKTTTLRMITTLLDPTGGEATVAGHDLARDPIGVRRSIGYVAQMGTTDPSAIVGEELVDHAKLYGIDPKVAAERGKVLLADLDLQDAWTRKCGSLSGGQRRRLDIAMGLIHEPKLVFLDEPSTGLDPQSRANLWHHIARLREEYGTTVFITTHYMDEADALCDRILIIDHGVIVAEGTPEELKRRVGGDQVILSVAPELAARTAEVAARLIADSHPEVEGGEVRLVSADGGTALPKLLAGLAAAGLDIDGVAVRRPTLDDVFLTLTGRSLRDDVAAA